MKTYYNVWCTIYISNKLLGIVNLHYTTKIKIPICDIYTALILNTEYPYLLYYNMLSDISLY